MPTLMAAAPTAMLDVPGTSPPTTATTTKITLSFGGVDFALHPDSSSSATTTTTTTDGINEVSYRTTSDNNNIILSLSSFTGRLVVSKTVSSCCGDNQQFILQPLMTTGGVSTIDNVVVTNAASTPSGSAAVVLPGSSSIFKVEMEPDSPEATTTVKMKKGRGVHRVSPGQQQKRSSIRSSTSMSSTTVVTPGGKTTTTTSSSSSSIRSKGNDRRKRPADQQTTLDGPTIHLNVTPKIKNQRDDSKKKTCRRDDDTTTIEGNKGGEAIVPTLLCQQMTQATQDDTMLVQQEPFDLSQTVASSSSNTSDTTIIISEKQKRNTSDGLSSNHRVTFFDEVVVGNTDKDNTNNKAGTSVQDILDQVNSSNDSVTTNRDDDDDDEEEEATVTMDDGDIDHNTSKGAVVRASAAKEDRTNEGVAVSGNDVGTTENNKDAGSADRPNVEAVDLDDDDMMAGSSLMSSEGYPPPPARWGHSMTPVQDGRILVYGGQSFDTKGNPIILSDVHVYDVKTRSWHKPINCRGEARQWHTATYIPSRQQIIAFGGETVDVLSSGTSNKPSSKVGHQPRQQQKIITSETLRVLDTDIMLWYPPAASGDVPTGRSGHTATFFPETNELVLFGGVRGSKWLNTVSVLDVTRWIWTTPKVEGSPPKPRSYHTATAVGGNRVVVFGGNNMTACFNTVHVLETTTAAAAGGGTATSGTANPEDMAGPPYGWKWSHPTVTGKAPFPRTGHSATLLEDGKTICIYGGWDPNEEDEATGGENIFQGSYLLDTESWTWSEGPKPQPGGSGSPHHDVLDCGPKRCGHTSALNSETGEVLVFGGRIPNEVLAGDVQVLVPPEGKAVRLEG